jgi:hypothetical protein
MERIQIWEGVAQTEAVPMEGITTCDNPPSPMRPMEGNTINGSAMPTIEEFSDGLISSGGMDDSQHEPNRVGIGAPDSGRDLQTGGNSGDPPTGPRGWSEKMGRKRGESTKRKSNKKNRSTPNTRLQQLEAEISNLKDKIKEKEKRRNDSAKIDLVISGPGHGIDSLSAIIAEDVRTQITRSSPGSCLLTIRDSQIIQSLMTTKPQHAN